MRFYIPEAQVQDGKLEIKGRESKHIRNVLRLKAGDWITVFDGAAREYQGPILHMSTSSVMIRVEGITWAGPGTNLEIILAQSILKGEKMDYLVQKATELGISEIIPFFSTRSIPRFETPRGMERSRRWERIAIEASKQSGRGILPRVTPPRTYAEVLGAATSDVLRLILWEKEGIALKEILKRRPLEKKLLFIVGPEGGLCEEEISEAKERGFAAITLGKRILRAETASLSLLSIIQYEWGDMG
jgi:16S rRNA (uracil1498-N3)-methyltransferase